jgi:hypothetical protein
MQAPRYYEDEVEKSLNRDVEMPGNDVIDKLRRNELLNDDDRMHLTGVLQR